jgi:nucleoside-diphosphate-sugar epimerase
MKILITGAAGFIGNELAVQLCARCDESIRRIKAIFPEIKGHAVTRQSSFSPVSFRIMPNSSSHRSETPELSALAS